MKFKVHFIYDDHDCTRVVDALNSDAAANQIRREYGSENVKVKKTKLHKETEAA